MRTQSRDTSPEAEQVLISLIRHASVAKRFKSIRSLTNTIMQMNINNVRQLHPDATAAEIAQIFITHHGKTSIPVVKEPLREHFSDSQQYSKPDVLMVLNSIVAIFAKQQIRYYLGGSLASSIYGMPQLVRDFDIVVDLQTEHVPLLVPLLQADYYIDVQKVYEAIQQRTSFSMLHLNTLLWVDVVTPELSAFEEEVYTRLQWHNLDEESSSYPISSPEDIVLMKLILYKEYEIFPDDQWNDVIGVLKVQQPAINMAYLEKWADHFMIMHLLERVYSDSGLRDP